MPGTYGRGHGQGETGGREGGLGHGQSDEYTIRSCQPNRMVSRMNQENATRPTMMAMGKFWKVNISFIALPVLSNRLNISEF
jgi:hypothetical protein